MNEFAHSPPTPSRVVVVGGGLSGLVAGAALARVGAAVTVLEAQSYLGGCAGTFYRKGYRFDAGVVIPAGFEPGGPMSELADWLGVKFDARLAEPPAGVRLDGVAHLRGGTGGIAETLCEAVRRSGGKVLLRRRATRIARGSNGAVVGVTTESSERFDADEVIANLTPWDLRALLDPDDAPLPPALAGLDTPERDTTGAWGALIVHAGIDASAIPDGAPLYHRIRPQPGADVARDVFVSISPAWDRKRAPEGKRAVTLATRTELAPWWNTLARSRDTYAYRKATQQDRLFAVVERVLPGFRRALDVAWVGTPVTYEFYTGRARGWLGGVPRAGHVAGFEPEIGSGLRRVGAPDMLGQSSFVAVRSSLCAVAPMLERLGVPAWRAESLLPNAPCGALGESGFLPGS